MPEPLTLAALGTVALTEGIKFLYKQAGELLKQWRVHREAKQTTTPASTAPPPSPVNTADILDGELQPLQADYAVVERLEPQIRDLRGLLSGYADEVDPVSSDERVLGQVDALRRLLEAAYGQRITFKGEARPASGTVVRGELDIDSVQGYAAAVRADRVEGGTTTGVARVKEVGAGATVVGVDVGVIR